MRIDITAGRILLCLVTMQVVVAKQAIEPVTDVLPIQTSPGKNTNPTHSGKAEVKSGQGILRNLRLQPPQNVQIPISTTSASSSSKGRVPLVVANVYPRPIMSPSSLLPIVFLLISHTSSKRSLPGFVKMCWGLIIVLSSSCIATRSIIPG
ncbi:hypothetical protein C8R42DRAFT_291602 [Lentinula raphanica]|nr:hypothetical protein C8R42DRAFT_291602 [Lentinula raphanica]